MQLTLETEDTNISISEKMSTLNQETGEKLVSKEVKELLEEVNGKNEISIINNEIDNKENVTANTEDHKESGDSTAATLQPLNEDNSSAKTKELSGVQCESQLIKEISTNAKEPNDIQSEIDSAENNETANDERKEENVNLNITEDSRAEIVQSTSNIDSELKVIQENLASEECPVVNNGISELQGSENLKESQMDIDEDKEIVEKENTNKQENDVDTETQKDIVEPMDIDCNIGRNLEEEVTESISAMVNEIVENLNQDDTVTADCLISKAADTSLESETTFKDRVSPIPNMDITEITDTDAETKTDDKNINENIDKVKEDDLLDDTEKIPTQSEILDVVGTASVEVEQTSLTTANENDDINLQNADKKSPELNGPLNESNTVENKIDITDNLHRRNSTGEATGKINAQDGLVEEKNTEHQDNAKKSVPVETDLTEKNSTSEEKKVECFPIEQKQEETAKDSELEEISTVPQSLEEKELQKKVTDNNGTITPSEREPIVESAADTAITNKQDNIKNIVPEGISKELSKISDDVEEVKLVEDDFVETQPQKRTETTPETATEAKKSQSIIKLSNTMDILSDDDEDEGSKEALKEESNPRKNEIESTDKQCINLVDDDDVMLIDDEASKDDKSVVTSMEGEVEPKCEDKVVDLDTSKEDESKEAVKEISTGSPKSHSDAPKLESVKVTTEVPLKPAQLVPDDFFKTYRKNLADMTRDDLEEFCILKIVESIIDRSNINDIRSKLKSMSQTVEEYKKKATMLTKQNRDLQVVLKSVQEEQKKSTNQSITPLKIMRSVGMQVLMTDKSRRRPPGPATLNSPTASNIHQVNNNVNNTNTSNNRQSRNNNINVSPRTTPVKQANNNQPIPVPRLVPAAQNMANRNLAGPLPVVKNNIQNGIKVTPPSTKVPEKRTHSRVQSVTVDLTDDEPPSKVPAKNSPAPPVRLVNTQNLLAQRPQVPQAVNSPRKVFIPINLTGPSTQNVRPGQTVLLKAPSPQGPKPRGQAGLPPIRPKQNNFPVKRLQGARHPAPLPDAMKQYQPPNWKALPPAPDLKLSKVENGIVISWKIEGYQEDSYEEIASYQLYAYQETSAPPNTTLWKKIGDVKALPLPMACTLTQFMAGYKYYFAVRAVDIRSRLGPFSLPGSILLLNKM